MAVSGGYWYHWLAPILTWPKPHGYLWDIMFISNAARFPFRLSDVDRDTLGQREEHSLTLAGTQAINYQSTTFPLWLSPLSFSSALSMLINFISMKCWYASIHSTHQPVGSRVSPPDQHLSITLTFINCTFNQKYAQCFHCKYTACTDSWIP